MRITLPLRNELAQTAEVWRPMCEVISGWSFQVYRTSKLPCLAEEVLSNNGFGYWCFGRGSTNERLWNKTDGPVLRRQNFNRLSRLNRIPAI